MHILLKFQLSIVIVEKLKNQLFYAWQFLQSIRYIYVYIYIYSRLRLIGSLFKWVSRLIGPLLAGTE